MGFRWEHPFGAVSCKLDEHGGEREQTDSDLYDRLVGEMTAALRAVIEKPEFAGIIAWSDLPTERGEGA